MSKKVIGRGKPRATAEIATEQLDAEGGDWGLREPMKRLTIDIPESLHREIKAQSAARGAKIADEVRALLIQKYRKS